MLSGEMVILMAIGVTRDSGKKLLTRPMDVSNEYICYLCDSMVERGYIEGNISSGYRLTWTGTAALVEFLLQDKEGTKDTVQSLKQLGVDKGQEIGKLAK